MQQRRPWIGVNGVALFILALGAAQAAAQPTAGPARSTREERPAVTQGLTIMDLMGSFQYARIGGDQSAQMNLALTYTKMLTDRVGIGGGVSTNTVWLDYTDTETTGEITLSPRLFLSGGPSRFNPYAALRLGLGFGHDDNPASVGAGFGLMYLLGNARRGAGLTGEVAYMAERYPGATQHRIAAAGGIVLYFR